MLGRRPRVVEASFLAAFFGGLLSLFSPCSALLLPAFFAYAFGSDRKLVGRTAVFYAGLCTTLVPLGMGISAVSSLFYGERETLVLVAGLVVIGLGVLQIFSSGLAAGPLGRFRGERLRAGGGLRASGVLFGAHTGRSSHRRRVLGGTAARRRPARPLRPGNGRAALPAGPALGPPESQGQALLARPGTRPRPPARPHHQPPFRPAVRGPGRVVHRLRRDLCPRRLLRAHRRGRPRRHRRGAPERPRGRRPGLARAGGTCDANRGGPRLPRLRPPKA